MTPENKANRPQMQVIESWLVTHLAETLGVGPQELSVYEPFEGLGLSSTEAVVLSGDLMDWLGVSLSPTIFWEHNTISSLAQHLASADIVAESPFDIVKKCSEPHPSSAQERFWFLEQLDPTASTHNITDLAFFLHGRLEISVLEWSLSEIVRRHETLRTIFLEVDGCPLPQVNPPWAVSIPVVNLEELPEDVRETQALHYAAEESAKPFDLNQVALFRAVLYRLEADKHLFVMPIHHLIFDGWSIGVLLRELGTLYTARKNGDPSPLADLPIQYTDYACWQRDWLQHETCAMELNYWKQQFASLPEPLQLPTDRPHRSNPTRQGAREPVKFPTELQSSLRNLSRLEGVSLFSTLLAGFQAFLYRYTGQEDIAVGAPVAGRDQSATQDLIGLFVNTLVLRADLSDNPTFREQLARTRKNVTGALGNSHVPFDDVVSSVRTNRTAGRHPLFQTMFAMQNWPLVFPDLPDLTVTPVELDAVITDFDLTLSVLEVEEQLSGWIEYRPELFNQATIQRMAKHYLTLLGAAVEFPDTPISQLPLMTEAERNKLLVEWNDTARPFPSDRCIHHLFENQVQRTPHCIALESERWTLTYEELDKRANQLAHYLQNLGVGPESLVGLHVESSLEMVVGLLGVLKAGGAYLPLDPKYPQQRIAFMLQDSQVRTVLTLDRFASQLIEEDVVAICLDSDWPIIERERTDYPTADVTPENLAYVIYTSGSTGIPKGVQIEHRSLVNFITGFAQEHDINSQDHIPQLASISFDVAVEEVFACLTHGGTLVLYRHGLQDTPNNFIKVITTFGITVLVLPTAYWHHLVRHMVDQDLHLPQAMRLIIIGGEQAHSDALRLWHKHVGNTLRLRNLYGPTEATIAAVACDISDTSILKNGRDIVPIGKPMANMCVYILDKYGRSQPIGVPGELYIGGISVGRGYLNRSELTKAQFIVDQFVLEPNRRLYRTGDLARYRQDGNIEYLGRLDHQVKLRGFRIELGEIETVLERHPYIGQAVVVLWDDDVYRKQLVGYVTLREGAPGVKVDELKQYLHSRLPDYMAPSTFITMEELPLTLNGKVDREALPRPDQAKSGVEETYVAPRNEAEKTLAAIWEEVLGLKQVGVEDDFFELGGDSILSLQISAKIYEQFKLEVPLAHFFQRPTVAGLSAEVDKLLGNEPEDKPLSDSGVTEAAPRDLPDALVPIHPRGSKPPLFCIHPAGGIVFPYYTLSAHLSDDQPLYGVQEPSFLGTKEPFKNVDEMVTYYLDAIRVVQPEGPYNLMGWSFGGVVVYEMAQQLHKQGDEVGLLGMLDTEPPETNQTAVSLMQSLKSLPGQILLIIAAAFSALSMIIDGIFLLISRALRQSKRSQPRPNLAEYLQWIWTSVLRSYYVRQSNMAHIVADDPDLMLLELPTVRHVLRLVRLHTQMHDKYNPKTYLGIVTLFRATERLAGEPRYENPETMGWEKLAEGGVNVRPVPGNHVELLSKPYVETLAQELAKCLESTNSADNGRNL